MSEFGKNCDGLRSICKNCVSVYNKEYRLKHKEYIKELMRKYKKSPEFTEYNKKWKREHPDSVLMSRTKSNHKRRAIKLNTEHSVTTKQINKLIEDSNNICFWCDKDIDVMHLDHIYPLSKGGADNINNIVVSCNVCNIRKNAKVPEVWLEEIMREEKIKKE